MIKLKYLLFELSDKVKNQFIDKVRKSGYDLTDDQFNYYIDIFEKRKDNKIFPSKDILSYSYDKDVPQKNQFTFKYLENLIDQNFSKESIKYDINDSDMNSKDIIYNQNGITIWDADTKEKCIKYGKYGNNYCVARTDSSNMFNSYRYKNKLTFYFVMDKTKKNSDPFSFFSIAVPDGINPNDKNKEQYYVTDKNNHINTLKSWNFIIQNNSNIKDLQNLFKSKNLTTQEYERYNKLKYPISDENYNKLNYDDKIFYIQMGHKLTEIMFFNSNSKIQDIYIQNGQNNVGNWYDKLSMKQKILLNKTQNKKIEIIANHNGWKKNIITGRYSTEKSVEISDDLVYKGKLLIKFDKVGGDFSYAGCTSLTSLEGAPQEIGGSFYCYNCESLRSLKGAPQEIGGSFYCYNCESLTSLEGAPQEIGGSFYCYNCESLRSLEGSPTEVGGSFYCYNCESLTSLEGSPTEVGGNFICSYCTSLRSLEGSPTEVGGNFICSYCTSLTSLKGSPTEVGGNFICSYCTSLTSLEGSPTEVGGSFYCYDCESLRSLEHLPVAKSYHVPTHLKNKL